MCPTVSNAPNYNHVNIAITMQNYHQTDPNAFYATSTIVRVAQLTMFAHLVFIHTVSQSTTPATHVEYLIVQVVPTG